MNEMKIFPIGKIENNEETVCIKLDAKYAKGLQGLDGCSHVQVLWWADGCDNEAGRNTLLEEKPYKNGPDEIGVFAVRSPERPNPIAVSNVDIAYVDVEQGGHRTLLYRCFRRNRGHRPQALCSKHRQN